MGDLINLNKARKAKAKIAATAKAGANRAKFGRTRAERERDAGENARADRLLDGARLGKD